ncbi:MAG: HPr family phosphocarrier protein [Deltaproteobacteria bacterium]|nr:HPr family phosphocarrier protein [Deltaproteobacteria bacterium]NCP01775.1 HPr family phosphocarrier protein [Deltaproteobacteria bacterium]NCP78032.1 HPr family phosphocarrier protein [Desulfuromonadales bacterium]
MVQKQFTIVNKLGLHARAAAQLVQTANRFRSEVLVEKEGIEVNGKSIMGILLLAAPKGSQISLQVTGEDEQPAMEALSHLIEDGFGED